jgi:signal transduction histidine kinase
MNIPSGIRFVVVLLFFHFGVLAQSKEIIDSLYQKAENAPNDMVRYGILTQIAEEYRYSNRDSSIIYVNKAKKIAKSLKSEHLDVDVAILEAFLWYEKGDFEESIRQLDRIRPLAIKLGDKRYLLKLNQTYGNSYGLSNDHRRAIEYELKALDYAKDLKDSISMAHLYINIGSDFHYIKEYRKGIEYCSNARQIYAKLGQDFYQGFALNNMSNYSNHLKDYQKALGYAEEASKYWNEESNERLMAYLYHNYGKAYKGLKNYIKSEQYYLKSIAIRTKNEDIKDLIITDNELADLYLQWNRLPVAFSRVQNNYRLAKEKSFMREEQQSAELLAEIHEKQGNFTQALRFLKISQQLKDSLQTKEQAKEVLNLQAKYQNAEKENVILTQEAKIADHQLKLKNRNFLILSLVALAIITGLTGFLLYKQQVLKNIKQQKDNELKLALEKIESQSKLQEQRLSISRDLHDNIGAQLSFIVSAVDTIKANVAGKDEQLTDKLYNIGYFAKETIQELRDTIWAMNKLGITIFDLQSRIANFIGKVRQSCPEVRILIVEDENIPTDLKFTALQGLNIFRIIQEATNNIIKYAEADHIRIQIDNKENDIHFLIEDNGKGFVENDIELGNGLLNMRKRALELGTELILYSEKGKGTRIEFWVKHAKSA